MPVVTPSREARASHLARLYRSHCKALLRFLGRKVGQNDASDLAHEAFLRIAHAGHSQTRLHNERAFLFQIAANLVLDHKRAQLRRSRILTAIEIDELLMVADETPGPEQFAQSRGEVQALDAALRELPFRRAEAFRLSRIEGLSHASIAARLGVSLRTVEAEVRMALDHCADRLRSGRSSD
ncbi:RNA polymerase sigma factor [Methylobacterium sp. J-048]|uniref:RNA polymerase sigma factor n=1 Tax=Methylobacterium sp. J-048 TaxID=2836635 RepID=UPI001FB93E15|nr:RNA polymerase sigma factor [Methylobacterium sp. J-048]MCJ2060778.1 RNA polymerase sigma factor [Methylobacterium sp. J-048]